MKTEIDFESICLEKLSVSITCRTCLSTDPVQQLTSIFDPTSSNAETTIDVLKLLQLLNIKIAKDDGYPENLCGVCLDRLVTLHAFQKQCEKVQHFLEQNFIKFTHLDVCESKPDINTSDAILKNLSNQLKVESIEIESINLPDHSKHESNANEDDCDSEPDLDGEPTCNPPADDTSEDEKLIDLKKILDGDKITCPICEKTFTTVANRNNHMYLHRDEKTFACDQCDMAFKCKIYLRKHRKRVHTVGNHVCTECGKKFTKTSKYEYHLKTHEPEKQYKCRFCEKSFIQHYHRKSHEQSHHTEKPEKPTCLCNICGKSFKHESGLKKHIQISHDESRKEVKKFQCDICKKEFIQKGSLKTHLAAHNNVRAYQCEQCGRKFTQAGTLIKHLALHNAEKSYQCEFCNESFLRIRDLRRHRLLTHGKTDVSVQVERTLDDIQETSNQQALLVKQEDPKCSIKRRDLPYGCDLCNRTFKLPSTLAAHVKTHSEERKFACNECGNTFKKLEHLKNHINGVHLKQAHNCEISKDDGFPTKICSICLARLVAIEDFRKHCVKVQEYLQQHFAKQTVFQQNKPTKVDDFSDSERSNLDVTWHDQTDAKSENADHSDIDKDVKIPGSKSKYDADFSSDSELDPSWEPITDDKSESKGAKNSDNHKPGKKYKCRVCEKSFKYARCRLSHERTHPKKSNFNKNSCLCNVCGKGFIHESSLKSHMKKHITTEKYSCDICQKEFSMKGSLKTHLNVHSNVKAYQCEQCGKKFRQMGALNIHLALHNADRPHKCEFCKESYLRIRDLRRHRLVVHAQTELTVKLLDEQEDSGDQLPVKQEVLQKEGTKKKPKDDLPYGCNLCSRTFKVPSSLASHIKTHSEDRKFVCNECGVGFKKLAHLKMHVNGVHLKKKSYSCEVCNKSFARVGDRNVHMRSHTEEKPHQCSYCGRGFHLAKALRAHTRQHTGERPFVCIICNAGFTCHKTLTSHTRRQHAGDQQVLTKVDEIAQATLSGSQKETNGSSSLSVCKIDSQT